MADCQTVLESSWYYRRLRLLRGVQDIGPLPDREFLQLVREQRLDGATEVMSPQLTNGQWVELRRVKLQVVQQNVDQRDAELLRRRRVAERRRKLDAENRTRLQQGIRSAIESGSISTGQRNAIEKFALAAGIPQEEVTACIARESEMLVREAFDDALADGILEPSEEQQISHLAIALGVKLSFDAVDQRRVALCRLAHELDTGNYVPEAVTSVPFRMAAKESVLGEAQVVWHEIVVLKRPQGIPLGGESYLKMIGAGDGYLTTKQVTMVGALQSQKFTLSSVQRVTRYTDGVLFNRSTGKSVFLAMDVLTEYGGRFALLAEHICSGEPVLGLEPTRQFIPEVVDAAAVDEPVQSEFVQQINRHEPRYTFRVVGDHIGDRAVDIRALGPGEVIQLLREPGNPYDSNAVAVYNTAGRQLGYLKREVAKWFSPILARRSVTAKVHTFTSSGSLILGVYF